METYVNLYRQISTKGPWDFLEFVQATTNMKCLSFVGYCEVKKLEKFVLKIAR